MKFKKCDWPKGNDWRERSAKRVAMANRAVKKELEAVALFPELAKFKTAEEKLDANDAMVYSMAESQRAYSADAWRRARTGLNQLPPITRAGLLRWWQDPTVYLPRDPSYLLDAIYGVQTRGESYWRQLRINCQYRLISAGKLPRSVLASIRAWSD